MCLEVSWLTEGVCGCLKVSRCLEEVSDAALWCLKVHGVSDAALIVVSEYAQGV